MSNTSSAYNNNNNNLQVLSTEDEIESHLIKHQQQKSSLQDPSAAFTIAPSLIELDLSKDLFAIIWKKEKGRSRIGEVGAILLADALKRNTTLKTLYFSSTY